MSENNIKIKKSNKDNKDPYKDYEPDGRDLIEYQKVEERCFLQNPNYDPEDHWFTLQTDIKLGK